MLSGDRDTTPQSRRFTRPEPDVRFPVPCAGASERLSTNRTLTLADGARQTRRARRGGLGGGYVRTGFSSRGESAFAICNWRFAQASMSGEGRYVKLYIATPMYRFQLGIVVA